MQSHRPQATMEIIKNARAHERPGGWRCYHGCYRDRDLQERTGGCFRRVPLFAALRLAVPDLGTGGRGISPLPAVAGVSVLETGPRTSRTHGGKILRGGGPAHNARRSHGQDTDAPCGGASPVRCGLSRAGEARKAACGRLMAHTPSTGQLCPPDGVCGRTAGIAWACRRGPVGAPHPLVEKITAAR